MLTKTPISFEAEDYRMYKVTEFISLLGIPAHMSFIPIFFYLGYDLLAYMNFASVAMWIYARVLNEQGQITKAITVLVIEVFIHAFLATTVLGPQSGFQFYFFALIPFAMFHQKLSKNGFFLLGITIGFAYFISSYLGNQTLHPEVHPFIMNVMFNGNIAVVITGLVLITTYFKEASLELEGTLKETIKDREVLLKEVHHRVKNNMQIIISLLHLQGDKYDTEVSEQIIQATESRINAMLLVHEKLFQNESVSSVDVGSYIEALADDLRYNLESSDALEMEITCDDILFHIDKLIPIGLIVNEAVTNSLKYADFSKSAKINIMLNKNEKGYVLSIKDNGRTKPLAYEKEGSIGTDLISGLAKSKLKGTNKIFYDEGTVVEIRF